jgi:hypothetical protein
MAGAFRKFDATVGNRIDSNQSQLANAPSLKKLHGDRKTFQVFSGRRNHAALAVA